VPDAKFCGVIDYTVEFAWVPRASPPNAEFSFLKREWRGPDGAESDGLRPLK